MLTGLAVGLLTSLCIATDTADIDTHCSTWAAAGECERNARYMLKRCAASCGHFVAASQAPSPSEAEDEVVGDTATLLVEESPRPVDTTLPSEQWQQERADLEARLLDLQHAARASQELEERYRARANDLEAQAQAWEAAAAGARKESREGADQQGQTVRELLEKLENVTNELSHVKADSERRISDARRDRFEEVEREFERDGFLEQRRMKMCEAHRKELEEQVAESRKREDQLNETINNMRRHAILLEARIATAEARTAEAEARLAKVVSEHKRILFLSEELSLVEAERDRLADKVHELLNEAEKQQAQREEDIQAAISKVSTAESKAPSAWRARRSRKKLRYTARAKLPAVGSEPSAPARHGAPSTDSNVPRSENDSCVALAAKPLHAADPQEASKNDGLDAQDVCRPVHLAVAWLSHPLGVAAWRCCTLIFAARHVLQGFFVVVIGLAIVARLGLWQQLGGDATKAAPRVKEESTSTNGQAVPRASCEPIAR